MKCVKNGCEERKGKYKERERRWKRRKQGTVKEKKKRSNTRKEG